VRRASFAEEGHGMVVLTGGMEWRRRLSGKSAVDGVLRQRGWANGAAEGQGRGGGTQAVQIHGGEAIARRGIGEPLC
jgi:hypothetical protein